MKQLKQVMLTSEAGHHRQNKVSSEEHLRDRSFSVIIEEVVDSHISIF